MHFLSKTFKLYEYILLLYLVHPNYELLQKVQKMLESLCVLHVILFLVIII